MMTFSVRLSRITQPTKSSSTTAIATVSQTGVSDNFKMPVPVYGEFNGNMVLLGRMLIAGNVETEELKITLPQKPDRLAINYFHDILSHRSESVAKGGD